MAKDKEVKERYVDGKKLSCPVCNHHYFWTRETLMNTTGMTFLGLEWANKKATNYICNHCGYVFWFLPEKK